MIGAVELAQAVGVLPPTDEQVAVIEAPLGPALVVAGAGSGKTETMAARVVYLVANGLVRGDHILGLTFTRKAASGLADRIRARLRSVRSSGLLAGSNATGLLDGEPEVSTYHAFGGRVISEFGPLMSIEPTAAVLTATGSWRLARQVVSRWDGDLLTDLGPDQVTERLLGTAGALADHLSDVGALSQVIETLLATIAQAPPSPRQKSALSQRLAEPVRRLQDRLWILPLVEAFAAAKRSAGVVDYADQMQLAADLVTRFSEVGRAMRSRYHVVLLDEYQDTGHAQRVILRALFGRPPGRSAAIDDPPTSVIDRIQRLGTAHPVTAVGDPVQSIYSWRGASSSNLPRFSTDFPGPRGRPSPTFALTTSFRNASGILDIANAISEPLRVAPVPVGTLRPQPAAPVGDVRIALLPTVVDEEEWLAGVIADRWALASAAGCPPPSTAVLVRRRGDMEFLAAALQAKGVPVEVVGIGGLLAKPEIADLLALLTVLVDPTAGSAALRVLTSARWRVGMADLDALSRRASVLATRPKPDRPAVAGAGRAAVRLALAQAQAGEDVDQASLIDAISDLGERAAYSAEGWRRLNLLGAELARLRLRLAQPLPDLIADLERATRLDIEVKVNSPDGRVNLDAFADIVADLSASGADAADLVGYLAAALVHEDGLVPGEPAAASGRVQVLTVHAAKGLEWEIVAVPHLSRTVFPNERTSSWLSNAASLPTSIRGDSDDLPQLRIPVGANQKQVADALDEHARDVKAAARVEERRLWYVAITRAERTLLLSGHHWGRTGAGPQGPSEFLTEVAETTYGPNPQPPGLTGRPGPEHWAPAPPQGVANPLTAEAARHSWPVDPLGANRTAVRGAAARVLRAMADLGSAAADIHGGEPPAGVTGRGLADVGTRTILSAGDRDRHRATGTADRFGWAQDVAALLAEREMTSGGRVEVDMPDTLSVTELVELARNPETLARRLRRPVPAPRTREAGRGTAFHAWVERFYKASALIALTDLPGAMDAAVEPDSSLDALTEAFEASHWASRVPREIEMAFATIVAGVPVRGRIDAVFADPDGGFTVVDWKTGRRPSAGERAAADVQLAVYRLATANLMSVPVADVRACFVYVTSGEIVDPVDFLDAQGLSDLIHGTTPAEADRVGRRSVAPSLS